MVNRTDILRVCTGIFLGLLLGVVIQQARQRDPALYAGMLSQGAFGGTASDKVMNSSAVSCHAGGDNCDDGAGCCPGFECTSPDNQNFTCTALSSSSSSWCVGDTNGDGICDDDPAHVCCNGVCQLPDMCSSSSSSAQQYCCAFDGSGCIAAPGNDPANDACDQNHTGYNNDTCDSACASSSQQWCCEHVLPTGPANCSQL